MTCISLCVIFLTKGQDAHGQINTALADRADSLYRGEAYFDAAIVYERILFVSNDPQEQYRAVIGKLGCLKKEGLFDQAVTFLEAWQTYSFPDSCLWEIHSQQVLCSYLGGHFENVGSLVDRWPYVHGGKQAPPLLVVLKILSLNELQRWKEAKDAYHSFMDSLAGERVDLYANLPHLKSVSKAQWLSTFIPGGGQFYAGRPGEALFSILVQAAGIYFGVVSFEQHYYVSAWLVGAALFGAFHMGGVRRAEVLVERYNRKKALVFNQQVKDQLLQTLTETGGR